MRACVAHVDGRDGARPGHRPRRPGPGHGCDYSGASYGTYLGATYAALFPDRVGRFVLDGGVDPGLSNEQLQLGQAQGFEHELDRLVARCVARADCPLGETRAGHWLASGACSAQPTAIPCRPVDDRPLTQGLAVHALVEGLYRPEFWERLTSALGIAEDGGGGPLRRLADTYYGRGRDVLRRTTAPRRTPWSTASTPR